MPTNGILYFTLLFCSVTLVFAQTEQELKPEKDLRVRSSLTVLNDTTNYEGSQVVSPQSLNQMLIEPAVTMHYRDRWILAVSAVNQTTTYGFTHNQTHLKEAYTGISIGEFDVTLGRRIVRWGSGYAFTPAGVLDPPRVATNPTDRLNTNVGRDLIKVDYVHGQQAMQVAWASKGLTLSKTSQHETSAFRYNIFKYGFDTTFIASHDRHGDSEEAMTFTRVCGKAIEVHGEFAWRHQAALVLGGKLTVKNGTTILAEFYTPPNTDYFRNTESLAGRGRQSYLFLRLGKSRLRERPGWKEWDLSSYAVVNLRDQSALQVVDAIRRFGQCFSLYSHSEFPLGGAKTEYGATPYLTATSIGVRFQL